MLNYSVAELRIHTKNHSKQSDLYEKDKNTFPYGMDLIYSLGLPY